MRELHDRPDRRENRNGHRSNSEPDLLALARLAAWLLFCAATITHAAGQSAVQPNTRRSIAELKIGTWNLEWLIAPAQFKALRNHCSPKSALVPRPHSERAIPCDVAWQLERSASDYAALRRYATELDADVVALQEVDGESAARLVFQNYDFCFTQRAHPQNNGFAVRRGIPHRCGPDYSPLAAGDSLRRGAVMTLFPEERRAITLLNVHLKSGCASASLTSPLKACRELAQQLPALAAWVAQQSTAGHRFGVVGDLNRDLLAEHAGAPTTAASSGTAGPHSMSAALGASGGPGARLVDANAAAAFRNCFPGQMHTGYIDHVLLDPVLARSVIAGSFQHLTYRVSDAHRRKLSDHCPVAIRLRVGGPAFD